MLGAAGVETGFDDGITNPPACKHIKQWLALVFQWREGSHVTLTGTENLNSERRGHKG